MVPELGEFFRKCSMPELATGQNRGAKFVSSAVWSSVGVVVSLITGLVLSPYLIRKLGPDGYGVWTLTFAMVEYYWLLDLGFRSATVKYVAHHWTLRDSIKTGEVISTALVYSSAAASLILIGLTLSASWIQSKFQISPDYQNIFLRLLFITTFSWCISIVFGVFGAAIESVQRFDLSSQANIVGTLLRTFGTFLLLYKGYGLVQKSGSWRLPARFLPLLCNIVASSSSAFLGFCGWRRVMQTLQRSRR